MRGPLIKIMVNIGDAHAMKCQGELCSAAAARRSIKERAKKAIAGNRIAPIKPNAKKPSEIKGEDRLSVP